MKNVIVIGGGWSGLSAAVLLAEKGMAVTVLEQSGRLGGRASSFTDKKTGDSVDNGQHLMMGCYTETLSFFKKIGALDKVQIQNNLKVDFCGRDGKKHTLFCPPLPAPFHIFCGVLGLSTLSFKDKAGLWPVYNAVRRWQKNGDLGAVTVLDWLKHLGQSERAVKVLWEPITLATLNETPGIAEADALAKVLKEAFFSGRKKSRIVTARTGLSDLVCGAEPFLTARGGKILLNQLVSKINVRNGGVSGVTLRDGTVLEADAVISAVPFYNLKNLLDEPVLAAPFFAGLGKLETSPIFSVSLWFDRPVMDFDFAGLLGTETQWVFNKSRILGYRREGAVTCVISGARKFLEMTDEALLKMCLDEVRDCLPESRAAVLEHSLIVREKNATLSAKMGINLFRPSQRTPVKNLMIAGDWTQTGLPATLESAVLSGRLAARELTSKGEMI